MVKANHEIRSLMREKKVPAWAIGMMIGCHENTVLRRLRKELSAQDKQEFIRIIDHLAAQSNDDAN